MLASLGRFVYRQRVAVVWASVVFMVASGIAGAGVISKLSTGGFQSQGAESSRAARALDEEFSAGSPNLLLLVTATKAGSVDDAAVAARGAELTAKLASDPRIEQAYSYWSLGVPSLKSEDSRQGMILARLKGGEEEVLHEAHEIAPTYTLDEEHVSVRVGGSAKVFSEITHQVEKDLQKAEIITFPVIMVLLIVVFGSAVAAGLPLGVGGLAVVGTLVVLRILTGFTEVSIFSLNLTTGLGLGLGIDYSLFIVSRFREELAAGASTEQAVVRSVETAGRTVLFSALTVAASLSALLAFPLQIMHSFAYAGSAVVVVAAFGSVVALPAVLGMLGEKVNRFRLVEQRPVVEGEGFWGNAARFVMKWPVPIAASVIVLLLALGAPFLGVKFGVWDDRVLGESAPSRQVQDQVRSNFSAGEFGALAVVLDDTADPSERSGGVGEYAASLSKLDGVLRVDAETGSYAAGNQVAPPIPEISQRFTSDRSTWLSVVPSVEPISPEAEDLVNRVRAVPAPGSVAVGGPSADLVDGKATLFDRLPLALTVIAVVTMVLLFLMTGSVLVPIKAMILNLLSLAATFGAMVWIFQEGHFADFLGFTPTGTLDTTSPILMFCVAFGLSMDYEVFLLSRIKEEHDAGADNVTAVARGLERTGRIVTAAASLLAVVFLAFISSEVAFIKLIGVGMMLAVLMDATLIRATLVPAFMRLAGKANWWAPKPLRRFHDRFGLSESGPRQPAFDQVS
ncbi:MAG TPA: MMPL family transporter [Actinomycetota bacterium]|nr:MMPL family transporter [Actinomycetota bacterium]